MTIEIFGAGFTNKGAELMLRTTVQRLRRQTPDVRLAIEPDGRTPYERTSELQLAQIFPARATFSPLIRKLITRSSVAQKLIFSALGGVMPAHSNQVLGLVNRNESDALLDISGYAFGDKFSPLKCKNAALRTDIYARQKKPVVFMPQMFGPFQDRKTRKYFKTCCDQATLIYARERKSYEAVREIIGDDSRLKIAPDITIFSEPPRELDESDMPQTARHYAIIVPNLRMLDQGREAWGETYLRKLLAAGQRIADHSLEPIILVHSNDAGDIDLSRQLATQLETNSGLKKVRIFAHENPYKLKRFISGARFLIGSRFHSLVAAFSGNVPGVALGWAHKYEMLAEDFGVPKLIHRSDDQPDHLLQLIDDLANETENARLRAILQIRRTSMKEHSDRMWQDVFQVIGLG